MDVGELKDLQIKYITFVDVQLFNAVLRANKGVYLTADLFKLLLVSTCEPPVTLPRMFLMALLLRLD